LDSELVFPTNDVKVGMDVRTNDPTN